MIVSKDTRYSIHSRTVHSCGQVFEEVLHLKQGETFLLNLSMPPFSPLPTDYSPASVAAQIEELGRRQYNVGLTGHIEKVEINGMQWNEGKGITCLHCGEELLFPTQKSEVQ